MYVAQVYLTMHALHYDNSTTQHTNDKIFTHFSLNIIHAKRQKRKDKKNIKC